MLVYLCKSPPLISEAAEAIKLSMDFSGEAMPLNDLISTTSALWVNGPDNNFARTVQASQFVDLLKAFLAALPADCLRGLLKKLHPDFAETLVLRASMELLAADHNLFEQLLVENPRLLLVMVRGAKELVSSMNPAGTTIDHLLKIISQHPYIAKCFLLEHGRRIFGSPSASIRNLLFDANPYLLRVASEAQSDLLMSFCANRGQEVQILYVEELEDDGLPVPQNLLSRTHVRCRTSLKRLLQQPASAKMLVEGKTIADNLKHRFMQVKMAVETAGLDFLPQARSTDEATSTTIPGIEQIVEKSSLVETFVKPSKTKAVEKVAEAAKNLKQAESANVSLSPRASHRRSGRFQDANAIQQVLPSGSKRDSRASLSHTAKSIKKGKGNGKSKRNSEELDTDGESVIDRPAKRPRSAAKLDVPQIIAGAKSSARPRQSTGKAKVAKEHKPASTAATAQGDARAGPLARAVINKNKRKRDADETGKSEENTDETASARSTKKAMRQKRPVAQLAKSNKIVATKLLKKSTPTASKVKNLGPEQADISENPLSAPPSYSTQNHADASVAAVTVKDRKLGESSQWKSNCVHHEDRTASEGFAITELITLDFSALRNRTEGMQDVTPDVGMWQTWRAYDPALPGAVNHDSIELDENTVLPALPRHIDKGDYLWLLPALKWISRGEKAKEAVAQVAAKIRSFSNQTTVVNSADPSTGVNTPAKTPTPVVSTAVEIPETEDEEDDELTEAEAHDARSTPSRLKISFPNRIVKPTPKKKRTKRPKG